MGFTSKFPAPLMSCCFIFSCHLCKLLFLLNRCCIFNPKRAGLFLTHLTAEGGGADSAPPLKISGTDRWNIKCVVLVDSYDPPEFIGIKKNSKTYLVWRHSDVISDVMSKTRKSPKIAKIMVFCYFFKQKLHFFSNDVCQSNAYTCSYSK